MNYVRFFKKHVIFFLKKKLKKKRKVSFFFPKSKKKRPGMQYTLVSFNCYLAIPPIIRFNGTYARAMRLANAVYSNIPFSDIDVLCLQELVFARDLVLKNFIHHKYHSKKISSSLFGNNIRFLHSGLQIVSKWPILEEDAHVFTGKTYNAEAMMAKAVQYCKILVRNTQVIHVFNTHLQAWTNSKAVSIRKEQIQQTALFMRKKLLSAASNEPIFYLGDGNVDFYENSDIAQDLMNEVQMFVIMPLTPQFSFDPILNPLVGSDDASEYILRKKLNNHTNGRRNNNNINFFGLTNNNNAAGEKKFFEESQSQKVEETLLYPRQLIDFFALSKNQTNIIQHSSMNVVPILSEAPFEVAININTSLTIQTVSDHFAVVGTTIFDLQDSNVLLKPSYINNYNPQVDYGWLSLQIVLFVIVLFVCILFCIFIQRCINFVKTKYSQRKKFENNTT